MNKGHLNCDQLTRHTCTLHLKYNHPSMKVSLAVNNFFHQRGISCFYFCYNFLTCFKLLYDSKARMTSYNHETRYLMSGIIYPLFTITVFNLGQTKMILFFLFSEVYKKTIFDCYMYWAFLFQAPFCTIPFIVPVIGRTKVPYNVKETRNKITDIVIQN